MQKKEKRSGDQARPTSIVWVRFAFPLFAATALVVPAFAPLAITVEYSSDNGANVGPNKTKRLLHKTFKIGLE